MASVDDLGFISYDKEFNPMGENASSVDIWETGAAYEPYVGRWSRLVAREFVQWLAVPPESRWLDVGCGTGALSETILQTAAPQAVTGIDRSGAFVAFARKHVRDRRVTFEVGDVQALSVKSPGYQAVVSGLMLNFVPEPAKAVVEMARGAQPGGVVAAYVWDYAGKMQLMRHFWNAASALDPAAIELDEGRRFPLCKPEPLTQVFLSAGLQMVKVRAIDIETDFRDFDDYWFPFLGGQGPAPSYLSTLSGVRRAALRERLRDSVPFALDGSIPLVARAWAIRGVRQGFA